MESQALRQQQQHQQRPAKKPHKCSVCGKGFGDRDDLEDHLRINHNVSGCKCEVCGKRFARENDLKTHLWTHSKGKPYSCDLCDRTFTRASRRNNHRNEKHKDGLPQAQASSGTGTKKSGKSKGSGGASGGGGDSSSGGGGGDSSSGGDEPPIKKKSALKSKRKSNKRAGGHNNNKSSRSSSSESPAKNKSAGAGAGGVPQCKVCAKKFASLDRLKTHLKVHSKKKLYPCELCDRTFSQIGSRNRHRRGMHKGEVLPDDEDDLTSDEDDQGSGGQADTFLCDLCDSSFNCEQYLEDHFLWVHNKNASRNCQEEDEEEEDEEEEENSESESPQLSPKRPARDIIQPPKKKQRK